MTEQNHHQLFRMARNLLAPCVEEIPAAKNLSGSAQVTAVAANKSAGTSDLAGALPHAPRRGRPRKKEPRNGRITIRFSQKLKAQITKRVKILETSYAAYFYELAVRDLGLRIDQELVARNRALKEAFNRNTVALNRVGNLINQMQASLNKGLTSPFSREEIQEIKRQHDAACRAHIGRLDHDH